MSEVRVMIVDDSRVAQDLFTLYINNSEKYELVRTEKSADFAERFSRAELIDLILMDILMDKGANGLIAAEKIKSICPEIKIIAVTSMVDGELLKRARKIGIESFWFKVVSKETILEVMDRTMAGESVYPDCVPKHNKKINHAFSDELTEGELKVLRLMTAGMSNSKIAKKLGISESTVKNHIHNMLEKTGCENRTILAIEARVSGIAVNID